ncbi:MAG: hypothetical protein E3J72_09735 [Planctomycetota bacterium]|nr:MAG: hypothetical protein E3J72_09735 [Planctomycetota bacterium]
MSPPRFSQGIEKILFLAALDEDFRKRLFADRQVALASSGVELTDAEHAILLSISDEQMRSSIAKTDVPLPARRAFLRGAASAALAILGSFFFLPGGCRDKKDPILGIALTGTAGISPTSTGTGTGTTGINPARTDDPGSRWMSFGYRQCYVNIPESYDRSVGAPALVFYHGESQDATDIHEIWKALSESEGFILICPSWAGTAGQVMSEGSVIGEEEFAVLLLNDLVNSAIPNLKDSQLYVGGFDTGAQVALATVMTDTDYGVPGKDWAGIVSWAGLLPGGVDPAAAPQTDTAVYLAAGDADTEVTVADVQALKTQLDGIGFPTNFSSFPGGHNIGTYDPTAAWDWISGFTYP